MKGQMVCYLKGMEIDNVETGIMTLVIKFDGKSVVPVYYEFRWITSVHVGG